MSAAASQLPPAAVNAKLIGIIAATALSFGVLLSGFVLDEPAPYDLYMVGLIAVWALFGLRISRAVTPLIVLLVIFVIGGMISMTQMADLRQTPLYLAVSLFLALSAVFYAAVTEARPDFYRLIFNAWVVAAVLTSLVGIAGYFNAFPGAEAFTLYGRAAGAFQDPNVFGPFLVLPGVWLVHSVLLADRPGKVLACAAPLLVIILGIFLSFSRGAWGLFAICTFLTTVAVFLRTRSGRLRLRIVVMSLLAAALIAVAIVAILQIPSVGELFTTRAKLVQDYDSARLGRFGRYGPGLWMAMQNPLGIGPLVFGHIFGEDTHDIWLKALLDYSWLGFAAYLTLIVWTLAAGFKILFRDRPWQPYLLCAYFALAGHVALGTIIDTDHWRHFYMLLGLVWGGIGLEARHQRSLAGWRAGAGGTVPAGSAPPVPF